MPTNFETPKNRIDLDREIGSILKDSLRRAELKNTSSEDIKNRILYSAISEKAQQEMPGLRSGGLHLLIPVQ